MQVRFYGTRGSIPRPLPTMLRHGGNTACVAVEAGPNLIVLDAGSGVVDLGHSLAASPGGGLRGHMFITHFHWDHIQGLPFFAPFWNPAAEWDIHAPQDVYHNLATALSGQMQQPYFPVTMADMRARLRLHTIPPGRISLDGASVLAHPLNHGGPTLGYRVEAGGKSVVYACDHEPFDRRLATGQGPITGEDARHADFMAGADLLIHDAPYTAAEYPAFAGWGHSTHEYAAHLARAAGVARVAMTHHDIRRTDAALDAVMNTLRAGPHGQSGGHPGPALFAAAEGESITL